MSEVRRWRELVRGTNGEVLFNRPKPTAGCSANGRRRYTYKTCAEGTMFLHDLWHKDSFVSLPCLSTTRLLTSLDLVLFDTFFLCCGAATQHGSWPPHSWGFLDHTQRRTTVGRTTLDEWSNRRRDLYLTTHNTHNKHPCLPVGSEPTVSAGERPQTYVLDHAATGTGVIRYIQH
jgi:hypothetical protein